MSIIKIIKYLSNEALTVSGVTSVNYGDIELYNNKKDIQYPYINFDIVSSNITNNSNKSYKFRIYVIDRNETLEAYNKTEIILDSLMNKINIDNYIINYFTRTFNDEVSGVFVDFNIDETLKTTCIMYSEFGYLMLENGDFLNNYLLLSTGGKIIIDN